MNLNDKGKPRPLEDDGLFRERLETLFDKHLTDLRTFAEREARPLDEVRRSMSELHCKYLFDASVSSRSTVQERILHVLRTTSRTFESLQTIAGLQSFFLVVNPTDLSDEGFLGGTLLGREFWRCHRGCGTAGAKAFQHECVKALQMKAQSSMHGNMEALPPLVNAPQQKKGPAGTLKAEVYSSVRNAIRTASGIRNAEMKWKDHSKLDVYGIRLVGWPTDVPMENPSSLSVAQNKVVLHALNSGTMHFVRITDNCSESVISSPRQEAIVDDMLDFSWVCNDPEESTSIEPGSLTRVDNSSTSESSQHGTVTAELPQDSSALMHTKAVEDLPSLRKRHRSDSSAVS
ncbi:uncharacterized protein LAESUDRAFT_816334 [Laetiporus sulphureus 93-53]|uniref:Uncharacterized protein n=1 Tax=Laetiporus sulphureus 93-53 TaxID=1314785 RepID=A0A165BDG7_9APHY|nr:uncharacterized protein LAESUDRAFT_816334 [Laetiporus sulphureus 93-53]KZT00803.1 hypothetical protein LAESUDRAFT_816334 [Laetiporus sulphureus 93-53]